MLEFLLWHNRRSGEEFVRRMPDAGDDGAEISNMTPELRAALAALDAVRNEVRKWENRKSTLVEQAENVCASRALCIVYISCIVYIVHAS